MFHINLELNIPDHGGAQVFARLPAAEPGGTTIEEKESVVSDALLKSLVDRLGLPADTTETGVLDAVEDALTRPVAKAVEPPEGTVLVDAAQWDSLKSQAAQGVEAMARLRESAVEAALDKAMGEGRFAPVSREHYKAVLMSNPEIGEALLESLAPNTIPVQEIGYGQAEAVVDPKDGETTESGLAYDKFYPKEGE